MLHAHLPYVRHPEHASFLEETWLFEAITETYVPLADMLDRLRADGVPFRLCLTLSPTLLTMLRGAAIPVALFVFGVSLSFRSLGDLPLEVPIAVAFKLVVHPMVVYLLLNWIGGFDPLWVRTAVIAAALPPAADVVRLATLYRSGPASASQAVLLASYVAVATVTLIMVLVVGHQ